MQPRHRSGCIPMRGPSQGPASGAEGEVYPEVYPSAGIQQKAKEEGDPGEEEGETGTGCGWRRE